MDSVTVQVRSRTAHGFEVLLWAVAAAVCFNVAYSTTFSFLICGYLICLIHLGKMLMGRFSFYGGLAVGLLCVAPQLGFFWDIFGMPAIALWTILACWTALFVFLIQQAFSQLGTSRTVLLAPFLWTGLEYFRSELYPLRFGWLNFGYSLSYAIPHVPFQLIGVYGMGFVGAFGAACIVGRRFKWLIAGAVIFLILSMFIPCSPHPTSKLQHVQVAGLQAEFPTEVEVLSDLNRVAAQCPDAQLIVLSEYTFDCPVPIAVRTWCHQHQKYLIVGGKDPIQGGEYYNTAFVVGPDGEVVFKQAKRMPIQFFRDGIPAPDQKIWDSPWGKIGICICYDLSYRRVTDQLIRLGAGAIIVPTMDVQSWGQKEHELHARIAPVRAAEYGIPILRVASSGISQLLAPDGGEVTAAPFEGSDSIISGEIILTGFPGAIPLDRVLAPLAVLVTGAFMGWLGFSSMLRKVRHSRHTELCQCNPIQPPLKRLTL